jgi:two-component system NtrC family sensor kinase
MSESAPKGDCIVSDEIERLRREIGELRRQLCHSQRLATVGTMAAMVAHEFNNILTPMLNYAQLAAGGDEAMREKALRHTLEGSQRAATICRALLDLTGRGEAEFETVSVRKLLDETIVAMSRDLGKDGIRLVMKGPAQLRLRTRPTESRQVLLNLLLNARSAALAKGRGQSISITAVAAGGSVRIRVADTGVGIPRENLRRIFKPFFTTKGENGRGLGLAVCREIVESLDGELTVRSQAGKGSCFTLSLPAADARRAKGDSRRVQVPAEA